jgi:hypothetical protein
VDSNDLGFGHRIGLAAKAGAIRSERVRPKCYPLAAGIRAAPMPLERFQGKRRGSRQDDASNQKNLERRFDSIDTEKALGMIEQVKVRQQVHGEIAAKRSVAVAAVSTDSSDLDRALIEQDIVVLMSLGC